MYNSKQFAEYLKVTPQTIHKLVSLGDIPRCDKKLMECKSTVSYWTDEIVKQALINRIGNLNIDEVSNLVGQNLNNKTISIKLGVSPHMIRAFLKYHEIEAYHSAVSRSKDVSEADPLAGIFNNFLQNHVGAITA